MSPSKRLLIIVFWRTLAPAHNRSSQVLLHPVIILKSLLHSGSLVALQIVSTSSCTAKGSGKYAPTMLSMLPEWHCIQFIIIIPSRRVTEHLGSGKFGTVKRGVWKTPGGEREVAVKKLQSNPASQDTIMFLQEAAIMGQFRHPNIVQLLGVVTLGEPVSKPLEREWMGISCIFHALLAYDCAWATIQSRSQYLS